MVLIETGFLIGVDLRSLGSIGLGPGLEKITDLYWYQREESEAAKTVVYLFWPPKQLANWR